MGFFEEFARKYFIEAKKDYERAMRAYREHDYPEAVFHAQQCVEKAVKALIESRREYVYNHGPALITLLTRVFSNEWNDELEYIANALGWFTEYYTRTRYPFLLRGKVVSPGEYIDENTCKEALDKASRVLNIVEKYLRAKGII